MGDILYELNLIWATQLQVTLQTPQLSLLLLLHSYRLSGPNRPIKTANDQFGMYKTQTHILFNSVTQLMERGPTDWSQSVQVFFVSDQIYRLW